MPRPFTVRLLRSDSSRTPGASSPKSSRSANLFTSMPIAIEMPKLSDTMTEGTLVKWLKKVGDAIAVGDILAEVETDKATMEMEAFDEGVLAEIYVQNGSKVEVGQKLAILTTKGEKPSSDGTPPTAGKKPERAAAPAEPKGDVKAATKVPAQQNSESDPVETSIPDRIKASPLAKKVATEK